MKQSFIKRSIYLLVSMNFIISCEEPGLYETIGAENLKSFPFGDERESRSFNTYSQFLAWSFEKQAGLSPYEKRRSVFSLFQNYEKKNPFNSSNILDFTTWQDLNLLCGPRSNNGMYAADRVTRTSTEFGRATLYRMIVEPVADIKELHNRQAIVREFISNAELFEQVTTAFEDLKNAEKLLLSFWQEDGFKECAQRKEIRFPKQPAFIDELNKNSLIVECNERLDEARELLLLGCHAAGTIILPTIGYFLVTDNKAKATALKHFAQKHMGISTLAAALSAWGMSSLLLKKIVGKNKWTKAINNAAVSVNYGTGLYFSFDGIKSNAILLRSIQAKLMAVAHYVRALQHFEKLFNLNDLLREKLPAVKNIGYVLNEIPALSSDFKKLLDQLSTDTFKGEPSLFSFAGRILTTFKLMHEQKDQLSAALIALGEVDAYMSIARLYKEGEGKAHGWCFAEFVADAHEPSIEIVDFWNPLLDAEKAIANSVAFGVSGNPRTLIITGPNAGGKSTIMMKGVPLCLILAQSFGIAPAKKLRFTPLTKIMTYLNITDDIAAGNSHFKAGVLRAQKMVEMAKGLKAGEFGFVAIDEVFNGTTYKEGQAAAFSLIEFLGKHPNIVCATATHFPLISSLEKRDKGIFKNYKVSVSYDEKGHIRYPFKLEPGISHQSVAFDILREEGFENDFLARANQVLQESGAAAAA